MKKQRQDDFLFAYVNRDSQRLREVFFSDNKEKSRKDNILLITLTAVVIFTAITGIIAARYDVFLIKKVNIELPRGSHSLLDNSFAAITAGLKDPDRKKNAALKIALKPAAKKDFRFKFHKPYNLFNNLLILYIKNDKPLLFNVIAKDTAHISNALTPLSLVIAPSPQGKYNRLTLELDPHDFGRVNFSSVKELLLSFAPANNEGVRVFVKNIVVADKNK